MHPQQQDPGEQGRRKDTEGAMGLHFMLLHFSFFCRVAMPLIRKRESMALSHCPLPGELLQLPARPRLSQQISLQPHTC